MDSRTHFLLELLQKLGTPLMGAVAARADAAATDEQQAQTMASLLSESVKAGISLSQAMNLKAGEGDADAVRVTLAALAGGLLADQYRTTGRLPGDAETQRMVKALESVIVFSDNFAPSAEHAKRLETLEGAPPFFDPVQAGVYSMHALVPAIGAVSEFSFGQTDTKLIHDISERLAQRAKDMLSKLPGDANPMAELVVLQALGQLYADAHRAETAKLRNAGADAQAANGLDPVWASFEKQAVMLETVMLSIGGLSAGSASGGGGSKVKPQAAAPEEQPAAEPATSPPQAPSLPQAPSAPANPMSFFKKK